MVGRVVDAAVGKMVVDAEMIGFMDNQLQEDIEIDIAIGVVVDLGIQGIGSHHIRQPIPGDELYRRPCWERDEVRSSL